MRYVESVLVGLGAIVTCFVTATFVGLKFFCDSTGRTCFDLRAAVDIFPKTTLATMAIIFAAAFGWSFAERRRDRVIVKYLTSALVGVGAALAAVLAFGVIGGNLYRLFPRLCDPSGQVCFDSRPLIWAFPKTTLAAISVIFAFAFRWRFRR